MDRLTDMTFLNSFTGGNPDKMKKYISMFLSNCPGQLQLMKESLEKGDYSALRGTAHALKPQITYMGIKKAEDLVKEIEHKAGSNSEVETLPGVFDQFNSVCLSAMEELKLEIA